MLCVCLARRLFVCVRLKRACTTSRCWLRPRVSGLTAKSLQLLPLPGLCAQAGQQPSGDVLRAGHHRGHVAAARAGVWAHL
jgi:hypothetical protein